jgi:hypothetical protein
VRRIFKIPFLGTRQCFHAILAPSGSFCDFVLLRFSFLVDAAIERSNWHYSFSSFIPWFNNIVAVQCGVAFQKITVHLIMTWQNPSGSLMGIQPLMQISADVGSWLKNSVRWWKSLNVIFASCPSKSPEGLLAHWSLACILVILIHYKFKQIISIQPFIRIA